MLYDNLFLLFSSFYNHLKPYLKFQPPIYIDPPFIKFRKFFQPPCLLEPPVYLALESTDEA